MAGEGLAISSGSNRGEAAYLGDSSFDPIEFGEKSLQQIRQNELLKKKEQERNAALLTDDIKTQWATDDLNYFQPKLQALKQKASDLFKKTNGKLDPYQRAEIQNDFSKLHNEAAINNKLRENYIAKIHTLDNDKTGAYDKEVSRKVLEQWNNPTAIPELKKDIDENYGGNINAWRAANEHKFQLAESYNEDKYFGELTKDEKPVPYQIKDKDGHFIYQKHPTGQTYYMEGKKLSEQQVGTLTNRVLSGTSYKDEKTKQLAEENIDKTLSITEQGTVGVPMNLDPASATFYRRVINNAGDLKGLNPAEIKKKLVRGYVAAQIETRNGEAPSPHELQFTPKVAAGPKDPKETITIASHYNNIAQEVQQNPNLSPDEVAQQFGGTAKVNTKTGLFTVDIPVSPTVKPFVAVPAGKILIQGKDKFGVGGKYHPNEGAQGQVAGTVQSNQIMWKKGGITVTPNTPGAVAYGQITYNPVKIDVKNEEQVEQGYALWVKQPGNENVSKEVYKQMLENGQKVGDNFKMEYDLSDPVQRTYYDQVLGGTSLSQTGFNKEVKAKGSAPKSKAQPANSAPVVKKKVKNIHGI